MTTVDDAVVAVESGGLVVFPTETVYGIGCSPDDRVAVERIFDLKGRSADKVLQLLVSDIGAVTAVATPDERALRLMDAFMPGPMTLVLSAAPDAPTTVVRDGTVGVRVPDHPLTAQLLDRVSWLASTSANRSGRPTPTALDGVRHVFGDAVDAYLDGGWVRGQASTVVEVVGHTARILREGVITAGQLEEAAGCRFEVG